MEYDNLTLMSMDVRTQYVKCRQHGYSREEAIALIRDDYDFELQDTDDRIAVLIGLVQGLSKKNELLKNIADETRAEIQLIIQNDLTDKLTYPYLSKIEKKLNDTKLYGDEAPYKQVTIYRPDWNIGDVFSHPITCPKAEKLRIMGWFILLYKIGEYFDGYDEYRQLMCISICPPDEIPTCYDDLKKLGFLPVRQYGEGAAYLAQLSFTSKAEDLAQISFTSKTEYLAQISFTSKRDENSYELTKIGNYDNGNDPLIENIKKEKPLVSAPLFGKLKRGDLYPDYEGQVCDYYKSYLKNT